MSRRAIIGAIAGTVLLVMGSARAEVKIGVAGPLTGPSKVFGAQFRNGASQAVEDLNRSGGILNQKILAGYGDDAAERVQGVLVANKFVADGVKFVIGHFNSDVTLSASEIYQAHEMLEITPSATNTEITERGMWNIFRTCGRDDQQGEVAGIYIAQHLQGKNVALVHNKTSYGKGLAEHTKATINAHGIREVFFETIDIGQTDFSALIAKVEAMHVDLLYVATEHTEGALLLKQMRAAGLKTVLMGGDGLSTEEFAVLAGPAAAQGTLMTFSPDPRKRPEAQAVVEKFRAKRFEPEAYTLYSYAAVQVIKMAAEAVKSLEPQKVAQQIASGMKFKTVVGELSYNRNGDITRYDYVMYEWKPDAGGKLTYTEIK